MNARRRFLGAAVAALVVARGAGAADFPTRSVRLLVGQAPGGQTDTIARAIALALAERWQVGVVVENQAGASATIAARNAAHAAPDGHTLLLGSNANLVLAPVALGDVGYDPLRDFAPIGRIARVPYVLVVRAGLGVATIPEFVALARSRPGALTVGTAGTASNIAVIAERFANAASIELLQVPYKGAAPAVQALLAGEVDATVCEIATIVGHAASGAARMLGMVGAQRSSVAADVPTLREAGYRDIADDPWYGILAPAQTPVPVLRALDEALRAALRDPALRRRFAANGYELFDDTPEEFARVLGAEVAAARASQGRVPR